MKNSKRKNFKGKKLATKLKKTYNFNLVRLKKKTYTTLKS